VTLEIRSLLRSELRTRRQRNPSYSMRAFAGFLGISYSFLAKILRGDRFVSKPMLEKMGKRLNVKETKLETFKNDLIKRRRDRRQKQKFEN
jgi:transcriptional regulator with XRE-family HTH domain